MSGGERREFDRRSAVEMVGSNRPIDRVEMEPSRSAFRLYSPPSNNNNQRSRAGLRVIVKTPALIRLTRDIVETFQLCDPSFTYSDTLRPKRYLTSPRTGVSNDGHDNEKSDLILSYNLQLVASQRRYIVKDILGKGTFGQVAKCWSPEMKKDVAVKIIKNHPAYFRQSWVEISILKGLNEFYDPEDQHSIVRILDYFVHQRHLCIAFEKLGINLYELLQINQHKGLSLNVVRDFSQQILNALVILKDAHIIHCDLKPENILLCGSKEKPTGIKVIDFGSACKEGQTIYSYIQTRHYRSPEVVLGYPYDTAIDMWSFGCIVAELFLGLPLFPGSSEFDMLRRMIDILGGQPTDEILRESKNTHKYFKHVGSVHSLDFNVLQQEFSSAYRLFTEAEYEAKEMKKPDIGKYYFGNFVTLEEIIRGYPYRRNLSQTERANESTRRSALIDFIRGLVAFDPLKRWTPKQASKHPFLTGEPFTCPYQPSLEIRQIPVRHRAAVEHNPGGGHWAAAGLSPQVANFGHNIWQSSPHFHQVPYSARGGSSYCSFGSFGSYNENGFQGGSYGDTFFSPAGLSAAYLQAQFGGSILGGSPDIRQRSHQIPLHGSGFGFSPTGNFSTMPLGASPSHFTPPSSQIQAGPLSPGSYGPLSPARASGGVQGSPLGKGTGFSKHPRKWNNNRGSAYHDSTYHHHQQHPHHDGYSSGQGPVVSPRHSLPTSNQQVWKSHRGGSSSGLPPLAASSSSIFQRNPPEISLERQESSSLSADPGDWDPNYSDELLLGEGNIDVTNLASEMNGLHVNAGSNHNQGLKLHRPSFDQFFSNERRDEAPQPYSNMESHLSHGHEMQGGPIRLSRFSQGPVNRVPPLHSANQLQRNRSNQPSQPARTNLGMADAQSTPHRWGSSWGS